MESGGEHSGDSQPQSQLKQQDIHPSESSCFSLSFSLYVHWQLIKEVPESKSNTKEQKPFCKV